MTDLMATEQLYRGLIILFSIVDFVLEKTPSDTIIKSTKSFVLSEKLIKSLSLIFETFLTSFPNLKLFVNNLSFKNSIKVDLCNVVYLIDSLLNFPKSKSQILLLF